MLRFKTLTLVPLGLAGSVASALAQPPTDIYLGTLTISDRAVEVGPLQNITDREGYDNQPHFTPDGKSLLFTSIREDGQADTYRYELAAGAITRVTRTRESEYSPTVMPDGRTFSVVQVEADSTQRLWHFDFQGRNRGLLIPDVQPVGYHAWGDENTVALYVLGAPNTLRIADLRTGDVLTVEQNIGRSLHKVPERHAISFVHRVSDEEWWIELLDLDTHTATPLVRTLPGSEHYAWTPDGKILMGQGSKLYWWAARLGGPWQEVADLAPAGISEISRIAVSPDGGRVAIVAQ